MVGKSAGKLLDWKNKTCKTEGEWGFRARKTLESGTTWVSAVENIEGGHIEVGVHCTWEFLELIV